MQIIIFVAKLFWLVFVFFNEDALSNNQFFDKDNGSNEALVYSKMIPVFHNF